MLFLGNSTEDMNALYYHIKEGRMLNDEFGASSVDEIKEHLKAVIWAALLPGAWKNHNKDFAPVVMYIYPPSPRHRLRLTIAIAFNTRRKPRQTQKMPPTRMKGGRKARKLLALVMAWL
jgi:hypothetical protein